MQESGLYRCGTVAGLPKEGTLLLRCSSQRTLYNPARVQTVAGLIARLPDPQEEPGEGLPQAEGRGRFPVMGREILLPGAGSMGVQVAPAGSMGTLKRRGISSPAPELPLQFG